MNELAAAWWPVITGVGTILLAVATLWVNSKVDKAIKEEKVDEKIADLAGKLTSMIADRSAAGNAAIGMLNERVAKNEARCETLTPSSDFHNALLKIGEIGGDMKAVRAELGAMHGELRANQRSIERVNDYLLEAANK
jgi:hypothetical protein